MDVLKFSYICPVENISQDIEIDYVLFLILKSIYVTCYGMKKKIQKPEDKRNIIPRNEKSSELAEGKCHYPKCNSVNLLTIGDVDFTLLFRL